MTSIKNDTNPYEFFKDPKQLYFFYEATQQRIKELKNILSTDFRSCLEKSYNLQLVKAQIQLKQIKSVIRGINEGECVSIEQVLAIDLASDKGVTIYLKELTQANYLCGTMVEGHVLMPADQLSLIIDNINEQKQSYGRIQIQPNDPSKYDQKQLVYMQHDGIASCDIEEVW